jgi:hypothetical protein
MYQVKVYHHDKDWVRGDLEDKFELVAMEFFKTRTAAKNYIESRLKGKDPNKVYRDYHKGDKKSYCYYHTGVEWQHENSGEQMREYYQYILEKTKLK